MKRMTGSLRATAGGLALLAVSLAGEAVSAPVFAPMEAPVPGVALPMPAGPFAAPVQRRVADAPWAAPAWRFRPVVQVPVRFPPPPPIAPWQGPPAFAGIPAFARQYNWRPPSPGEAIAWGERAPRGVVMAAPQRTGWLDGSDYRFRPLPAPVVQRPPVAPPWASAPRLAWLPHGPYGWAAPAVPAAPWVAAAPRWPTSLPAWHPSPAPAALQAFRFRPDQRLGPDVVRLPAAPPHSPALAWTAGGGREEGDSAAPIAPRRAAAAPAWDRAYN